MLVLFLMLGSLASEIKSANISYNRFIGSNRFLELPAEEVKDKINLSLNIDLIGPVYWNNNVFMLTTPGRVAWIGYQFEVGVNILNRWFVYYEHISQHSADKTPAYGFFPVNDSIGISWRIL